MSLQVERLCHCQTKPPPCHSESLNSSSWGTTRLCVTVSMLGDEGGASGIRVPELGVGTLQSLCCLTSSSGEGTPKAPRR